MEDDGRVNFLKLLPWSDLLLTNFPVLVSPKALKKVLSFCKITIPSCLAACAIVVALGVRNPQGAALQIN
jgi:hypothetical protein